MVSTLVRIYQNMLRIWCMRVNRGMNHTSLQRFKSGSFFVLLESGKIFNGQSVPPGFFVIYLWVVIRNPLSFKNITDEGKLVDESHMAHEARGSRSLKLKLSETPNWQSVPPGFIILLLASSLISIWKYFQAIYQNQLSRLKCAAHYVHNVTCNK